MGRLEASGCTGPKNETKSCEVPPPGGVIPKQKTTVRRSAPMARTLTRRFWRKKSDEIEAAKPKKRFNTRSFAQKACGWPAGKVTTSA
jgi:hypothetical protein